MLVMLSLLVVVMSVLLGVFFSNHERYNGKLMRKWAAIPNRIEASEVVSVDVIDYNDEIHWQQEIVKITSMPKFKESNCVVVQSLNEGNIASFSQDISSVKYFIDTSSGASWLNVPNGRCLRIIFNDDTTLIIALDENLAVFYDDQGTATLVAATAYDLTDCAGIVDKYFNILS